MGEKEGDRKVISRSGARSGRYTAGQWAVAGVFLALAVGTRFYRLESPAAVVFDEFHFGKFTNWMINGSHFYDIHPPLGKLTFAGLGYLGGYRPVEGFMYDNIGVEYNESGTNFLVLRAIAASFGSVTVPLCYFTALELDLQPWAALVPPITVLLDFLNLVESRLILMDSQLLFWCALGLYCALRLWRHKGRSSASLAPSGASWAAAALPRMRERSGWLLVTAVTCGLALNVKWTALATPGVVALVSLLGTAPAQSPLYLGECVVAAVVGIGVYTVLFKIAFVRMWKSGSGDAWMPMEFQRHLVDSPHYDPAQRRPWFWRMFVHLNVKMATGNASITARHPWESDWFMWIANWRGVLYWSKDNVEEGKNAMVYLLGNPAVIWFCLLCTCVFVVAVLLLARYRRWWLSGIQNRGRLRNLCNGLFLVAAYFLNLLPYILVDRAAFIYHYIPGLYYAMLLSGVTIDFLPRKVQPVVVVAATSVMAAAFVYWSPWVYALPLTPEQHDKRRWLPRWN